MPLSEHEQRILAELEESLYRQDPDFAERVRSETVYKHAGRHCKWAAVGFLAGVVIVIGFVSVSIFVALIGVAIMFGTAVVFERNLRRMGKAGWRDLTHTSNEDEIHPMTNAVHSTKEWIRTRFRREA